MAKKNTSASETFIEINGKRYDTHGKRITAQPRIIADVVPAGGGQQHVIAPVATPEPEPIQAPVAPRRRVMDITPAHIRPHRAQTAKTLMRSAVKKPAPGLKKQLKAATRTDILARKPGEITVVPKISYLHVDPKREARASRTHKSELVHKFADQDLVSAPAPRHKLAPQAAAAVALQPTASVQHPSADIFERALARADAHTEKSQEEGKSLRHHKKARTGKRPLHHRTPSIVAASLAVLLLTGFIAYQNKAAITLRYASAKAGFHATLPGYKPSGFALGRFSYHTGNISVAFKNSASSQSFTLSQQPSNWDSQTLLENVVAVGGRQYQAIQRQGQTIYVYGDNNAAWVSGGILYELNSQGNLSTSQLLDVASSM